MPQPWTRQKLVFWTVVWGFVAAVVWSVASAVYVVGHFVEKFW